jgi:Transglycosylase SLT domain
MRKLARMITLGLLVAVVMATVFTVPASAQLQRVTVQLSDGSLDVLILDLPEGITLEELATVPEVTGTPISVEPVDAVAPADPPRDDAPQTDPPVTDPPGAEPPPPGDLPTTPAPAPGAEPADGSAPPADGDSPPASVWLGEEPGSGRSRGGERNRELSLGGDPSDERVLTARRRGRHASLRETDGTPTPDNPGFTEVLPGPARAIGVPNFIIEKFHVPPFLLSIYQAAGVEYGVRWEVLAAINEIESDYGRNLNVSSAGAIGWMQFLPSTWKTYGVDANSDGKKDPYNPVDAIFAAARYLNAAGYEDDVRGAIFAYNHADWYVDSVLLRARLIAGVPVELIGSLTGLTEGRFPVAAPARYADDLAEQQLLKRVSRGENAANLVESSDRRSIDIFTRRNAPVVAVNDGVIKRIGRNRELGRYVVLEDVYGNSYSYAHLGKVPAVYPVPNDRTADAESTVFGPRAHQDLPPDEPASAGHQQQAARSDRKAPESRRLFAHPYHRYARKAGGLEQQLEAEVRRDGKLATFSNYFARPFGADPSKVTLRPLTKGARVIGGTIIGRVGRAQAGKAPHVDFSIRPAGRGAPLIDPKPVLDGWKLLEATAIYRANGENALRGGPTIGQILLLPKSLLEKRVLADERIQIYACGRADIRAGQIDRRVLATVAYLSELGLSPTVSSLRCGHGYFTKSGNISEHSSGNAVDISKINGIPVMGHQEPDGVVDQAVRRVAQLQGVFAPHQVISLLDFGGPTLAMADHADHIHVGFQPAPGASAGGDYSILKPYQWPKLLARLSEIRNPIVEAPQR